MDPDDPPPKRTDDPLRALAAQDLDPFSVAELDSRITALEAEIVRTRARRHSAAAFRSAADRLFGR